MANVTRVLLVDDQVLYREALSELVGRWPEFCVVAEASNGLEAVEECGRHEPDLVLMDIQMPIMNGVEAAAAISRKWPDTTVVMLTVSIDDQHLFGALCNGARGYILKNTPAAELRGKMRGAMRGEGVLSGEVAAKLIDKFSKMHPVASDGSQEQLLETGLTEREVDIVRLVAQGFSNEEIAAKLYLSTSTVKKQLGIIMQKHSLHNRVQIAVYAMRMGLG
ncbi:MAG: response regulator transcription factor [Eggerthellaceae bacterium]|nr:response regulator transcription factor [Eggerthellaceae bacterium]